MKKPFIERRPWGQFERFTTGESVAVKILTINPGGILSLQYHKHRDEFWKILQGEPILVIGKETIRAKLDEEFFVPRETNHRITAQRKTVKVLEIAFGQYDENDIVRLEDKYHRI